MFEFKDYIKKKNRKPIVILGAGLICEIFTNFLKTTDVEVKFIVDSKKSFYNKKLNDIKIVNLDYLENLDKNTDIFISHRYIDSALKILKEKNFTNIFSCRNLFGEFNRAKFYPINYKENDTDNLENNITYSDTAEIKADRLLSYYVQILDKSNLIKNNKLHVKSLDVQVSEKCSLKCADCCNLMQYYKKPKDIETEILIKSIEKFMKCVDSLDEFRVLGGDPFMNKDMHKIISKLVEYDKCQKIIVYTNARFMPKGENLESLKHKKIILEITDYGEKDSLAASKFVEMAKRENINYEHSLVSTWDDAGRIMPYIQRSEKDLKKLFSDCCQQDLISLLHGKLYRCPFSANAANLKAIPQNKKDEVNLLDENLSILELREQVMNLVYEKEYLTACSYCKGRTYYSNKIKSANQTKKPLEYKEFS